MTLEAEREERGELEAPEADRDSWLGENLKAAGFSSVAAFANHVGVPKATAHQWVRGCASNPPTHRPPARLLPIIANALKKVSLAEAIDKLWGEKDGDDCPCGKCGGKRIFEHTPPEARRLWIVIPCAKCGTTENRMYKPWKEDRHRKLCAKCGKSGERAEYTVARCRTCGRTERRPSSYFKKRSSFDPSSNTYECNNCGSLERMRRDRDENLRDLEAEALGAKKSNIKIRSAEASRALFRKHRHQLYGGKLRTGFTPEEQERGRRRHIENASAGKKYPKKTESNLKRHWENWPKGIKVAICDVCRKFQVTAQSSDPRYHKKCHDQVWERSQAGREFQSLKVTQALERRQAVAPLRSPSDEGASLPKRKRGRPKRHSDKDVLLTTFRWMIQHLAGDKSLRQIAEDNAASVQTVANHIHSLAAIIDPELLAKNSQPKVRFLLDAYEKKYPGKRRVSAE
jgi:hypothetical protein